MAYKFNPFIGKLDNTGPSVSALNVLGTVTEAAELPGSGNATGDVYQAEDTGVFYVWDGSAWDNLGTLVGPQGPTGATGPTGPAGADGTDGADGVGIPVGGTNGQALVKASNTDYDTEWADVTAVAALDDLTDVTLTSPSDGQVLEYDSATSTWVNATPSGGGGTPGGTTGQIQFNDGGSFGGATGSVVDASGNVTIGGLTTLAGSPSANNTSGVLINGTWRTGASSNNPQLLLNPSGTTLSTTWDTNGTGIGVNAPSGFGGNLLDLQVNGTSFFNAYPSGSATIVLNSTRSNFNITSSSNINLVGSTVKLITTSSATGHSISLSGLTTSRDSSFTIAPVDSTSGSAIDGASITIRGQNRTNTSATLANGGHVYLVGGDAPSGNPNPFNGGHVYLDSGLANSGGANGNIIIGATRGNLQITDARNVVLGTTTGTKIGTATTQKLGFYNAAPVVQPTAVADADAATVVTQLNALLARMRDLGLIAT